MANAIELQNNENRSVVEQKPALISESAAIIQVIERAAMNPSVDIDKMERLLEMQERIMAKNAKAAYASAFSQMQPHLPEIPEKGRSNNGSYALWEDINDLVKPVLAEYGFGISFQTGRDGPNVTVTAILTHRDGHSEQTTMLLPVDTSGNKNAVQAVGSSTSYGKRYTASALLNLTSRGEDDDGKSSIKQEKQAPPAKSSASLKKRDQEGKDAWDRLMEEFRQDLLDCHSEAALSKLRAEYRERARNDRWPRAWLEALGSEFDSAEDAIRADEAKRHPLNAG